MLKNNSLINIIQCVKMSYCQTVAYKFQIFIKTMLSLKYNKIIIRNDVPVVHLRSPPLVALLIELSCDTSL